MEYTQWQQPPATATVEVNQMATAAEVNQPAVDAYYASYYAHHAPVSGQTQNPDPSSGIDPKTHESSATATATPVPGADVSYASGGSYPDSSAAAYYVLDTNQQQNWSWGESVQLYGTDPHGHAGAMNRSVQPAVAYPGSSWTNHLVQAQLNGLTSLKNHSKKAKIVQSAYCEVCKVDCNSQNVFEQHKLGKKHQKNLEKIRACSSTNMSSSVVGPSVPMIGPQENPDKSKEATIRKNGRKAAESIEDLETKRRKVVECGAAVEAIRLCTICNVVCNSDKVFRKHLAGQKHAAMALKLTGQTGVAPVN